MEYIKCIFTHTQIDRDTADWTVILENSEAPSLNVDVIHTG